MKRSIGAKTLLYPHPVCLVGSYDREGRPNLMAASWAGICCSRPPCVAVSLRAATYSHGALMERRAFTVGIASEDRRAAADGAGVLSGRDGDKFAALGWTPVRSERVDAPYPAEVPLVLECRVIHVHELGLHTQFVGEILDLLADEAVLGPEGLPAMDKVRPLVYSTGDRAYFGIGARLGEAFVKR